MSLGLKNQKLEIVFFSVLTALPGVSEAEPASLWAAEEAAPGVPQFLQAESSACTQELADFGPYSHTLQAPCAAQGKGEKLVEE